MIATLMLINGVVVISAISATVASRIVPDPHKGDSPTSLDDLDARLARIEAALGMVDAPPTPERDAATDTDMATGSGSGFGSGSGTGSGSGASDAAAAPAATPPDPA